MKRTVCIALVSSLWLCWSLPSLAADETLRVTLLGTGVPTPSAERYQAATLIEAGDKKLLVDAGRGVSVRLWQLGIPLSAIDAVFLTHFHSDHINGLADLWATGWLPTQYGRRQHPLAVWGPVGTSKITAGIEQSYAQDVDIRVADEHLPREAAAFSVTEFSTGGVVYQQAGIKVTAFEVNHGELIKPAYGYRVDYGGHSVLISGDTKYDERIIAAAKGVDVLIHEVMSTDDRVFESAPQLVSVKDHHTMPAEAGTIFARVKPKLAVYTHIVMLSLPGIPPPPLSELVRRTRTTYDGPLVVGEDLMRFEIGDSVAVYSGR
jgi:ribonuclease Z